MNSNSDLLNPLLIVQSWRDSSALIKSKLVGDSFSLELWATISQAEPNRVTLTALGGEVGHLTFDPSHANISYQEPREADASIKADAESKVVCALRILLPEGVSLLLYERRSDDSEAEASMDNTP